MIAPRTRLLFWFAAVALPGSVLGAIWPDSLGLAGGVVAAFALLAAVDLVAGLGRLESIRVELPEVGRFSKDREGKLEVRLRNEGRMARRVRLGLPLPRALECAQEEQTVLLPAGSEWSRVEWRIKPLRRGCYRLHQACLGADSPLGFWALRALAPVRTELRVYPNLLPERKHLAALFLDRAGGGVHAQRQVGKGREFEKLREYIPGDSFEDIHWKATAKRGRPVTKVFQIERTQEVYVVIDASRLSARAPLPARTLPVPGEAAAEALRPGEAGSWKPEATVLERYVVASLVLGLAAEQQGDLFGLMTFSDNVGKFVRARNGRAHYQACRDAIYALEPRGVTPDFDEMASFIRLRLRRRALLVFLTALDDPVLAESFVRSMDLLSRQHLLLVNMMKPPGADPLFGGRAAPSLDDLYAQLGGHLQWHSLRELGKVLQRRGVRFSLLDNEALTVQVVSQYLAVKQRQLL